MLVLSLLFACACAALAAPSDKQIFDLDDEAQLVQLFNEFKQEYKKNYHPSEYSKKFEIFVNNLAEINAMNERESTATYGINEFTDITAEEFLATHTGFVPDPSFIPTDVVNSSNIPDIEAPQQFDWRTKNVVTNVKNQGHCRSCWAFSAVGNIEGQYALKHRLLVDFSPQELVSCVRENGGCAGGWLNTAFQSLQQIGGVETDRDYPYVSGSTGLTGTCTFDRKKATATITGYKTLQLSTMTEDQIAQLLVSTGPLATIVHATPLNQYRNGIINDRCRDGDEKDLHAVLLVGYGEENGVPYWTYKNSWGTMGEQGYFRTKRGVNCLGLRNDYAATCTVA